MNMLEYPNTIHIFLKVIVCAVILLSTNFYPLQIIAESNQTDIKPNRLEFCPTGEDLVKPVTRIQNGKNVTFTNTLFGRGMKEAIFNGVNEFQTVEAGWVSFPGENHRLMDAKDRLFSLSIFDRINISMTLLAAGIKFDTTIHEMYEVTIPYEYIIHNAKGDEHQKFNYQLFNANQVSLKEGFVQLTKNNQTGTVNFTFIGTGATVGLAFGIFSTSSLKNNHDHRIINVRNPSVKMKKQIQQIFPDVNLARAVAAKLGKQITDYVFKEELEAIQDLTAINNSIENLNGMQCLTNIQDVHFSTNNISDLNPLSGLIKLTYLRLDHNQISDLSPLIGLNQLSQLYLGNNQIQFVNSLSELTNLTALELSVNQISDIRALTGLHKISNINLTNQTIQLSLGTILTPTLISISNPNGSIPPIDWLHGTGTYENGELVWSTPGDNQLTWSNYVRIGQSNSIFNGKVSQTNKGFLYFNQIPDYIIFKTSTIPLKETLIHRDDSNWEFSVYDELRGRGWYITATIDTPLTSTSNSSHKLLNALVYVDDEGNTTPVSKTPIKVFDYTTGTESIIHVNWDANKGILLKIKPSEVFAETYTTTINWTLTDAP